MKKSTLRKVCAWLVVALGASGCASMKSLQIETSPPGAEVRAARDGKVLGVAPLTLQGEALETVLEDGLYRISVRKEGHVSQVYHLEAGSVDRLTLKLTPATREEFSREVLPAHSKVVNEMLREILRIQGLLVVKRVPEAQTSIQAFQKAYPLVASGYVLEANLALMRGDRRSARGAVERALQLDPDDAVAVRLNQQLRATVAQGGAR